MATLAAPPVPPPAPDSPFRRYWRGFLRRRAGLLVLALLVSVIEGSTLGALSWLLEPLFDQVFAGGSTQALVWVGGGILGLFLVRAVSSIFGRMLMARVNQETAADMQVALLRHILTLDGGFFLRNAPGGLIERVVVDTTNAQGGTQLVIAGWRGTWCRFWACSWWPFRSTRGGRPRP